MTGVCICCKKALHYQLVHPHWQKYIEEVLKLDFATNNMCAVCKFKTVGW